MSQYSYGVVAERRLMRELEGEGFAVTRASSSKGNYDLIATREDVVWFVSVKRCATWKRATTVYRAERRRLESLALPRTPKIKKVLAIWSDTLGPETPGRGGMWYCRETVDRPAAQPEEES